MRIMGFEIFTDHETNGITPDERETKPLSVISNVRKDLLEWDWLRCSASVDGSKPNFV
ncbi:hypothetical protein QE390_004832 [Siphonobacter sp. SORGH_AS 1065]|nr:hypothetical protein [Siphonobacter sp. SORGH_AS_1065]